MKKKIELAKFKLFKKELVFFGIQLFQFEWVIKELPDKIEGCIVFDNKDLNQIMDKIIYLNKDIVIKEDYTHKNLCYVLVHELLHILNKHAIRKNNRTYDIWCVACDHVIERFLKYEMNDIFKPYHKSKYNIIEELHDLYPYCTTEEAYDWIKANSNIIHINLRNDGNAIEVKDKDDNLLYTVNLIKSDKKTQEAVKQMVSEAQTHLQTVKEKGSVPHNIITYLDKILKVEIPWESLLEKAIKTNVILKPDQRSWKQRNKYFIPLGINLPGYSLSESNEGVGILIICVDTSGSISKDDLKKFAYVIQESMRYFQKIITLVHDIEIHQIEEFDKDNIASFYSFLEKGLKGRGGTSHDPAFKYIEKELWEKFFDEISMIISLTDMYSDIQEIYKNYKWVKEFPLVFIITKDGSKLKFDSNNITQIQIN